MNSVQLQWGAKIPLRDGTELSALVYLPAKSAAPRPAILSITPYTAQRVHPYAHYFATNGFPFVTADVRGRGNSQGEFVPFVHESSDGAEAVAWVAAQPFCNGRVAMWGGSYSGFAQWATARTLPPALTTLVPVAAPCVGVDFPFRQNVFPSFLMQWLTLVWGRTLQEQLFWNNAAYWGDLFRRWFESGAPFKQLDAQLGNPSAHFQSWLAHPRPDEHWAGLNPSPAEYARITFPVLTITGMFDGDQPGALAHYRQHREASTGEHYLVIGPWDHAGTRMPRQEFCGVKAGPASLIDLPRLHLEWYRWTMLAGAKPTFLKDKVAYYVLGADVWRYASTLEAATARFGSLYLSARHSPNDMLHSGALGDKATVEGGPDRYIYDPRDTAHAALEATVDPENRADMRLLFVRSGKQLVYYGVPFQQARELCGFFSLSVWLAIDQPDTDFQATIDDVAPDGTAIQLTRDFLRARYRLGSRQPALIDTVKPLRYDFTGFFFVSYLMQPGHRLRLTIGPIDSIYHEKNYNSGGVVTEESIEDARPVTVKLFHDEMHPSALCVPFGHPES